MTNLQKLITLALPQTKGLPNIQRADMLSVAAELLEGDLASACSAEAVCLRNAEAHQLKLDELLEKAR